MAAAQLCGHQDVETLRFHAGANFFNTVGEVDILHGTCPLPLEMIARNKYMGMISLKRRIDIS
jgi:hypothetical protein